VIGQTVEKRLGIGFEPPRICDKMRNPPAHLSVLSVGVGVSVINGFGSTVRMVAWSGPGLQAVRREDG
jgi:hypothetical protein